MLMDRRVPESLLALFDEGGPLRGLLDFVLADRSTRDLQLRSIGGSPSPSRGAVGIYVGMSRVLSVELSGSSMRFDTHDTYQGKVASVIPWRKPLPISGCQQWAEPAGAFCESVVASVRPGSIDKEGIVHAMLAQPRPGFVSVNRELAVGFPSSAARSAWLDPIVGRARGLLTANPATAGMIDAKRFGTGVDFLGVDDAGRLLAIEAKPALAGSAIAAAPVQVWVYAQMLADWASSAPTAATIVDEMARQRVRLGLAERVVPVSAPITVVPVVAIGPGTVSDAVRERMNAAVEALSVTANDRTPRVQVWDLESD